MSARPKKLKLRTIDSFFTPAKKSNSSEAPATGDRHVSKSPKPGSSSAEAIDLTSEPIGVPGSPKEETVIVIGESRAGMDPSSVMTIPSSPPFKSPLMSAVKRKAVFNDENSASPINVPKTPSVETTSAIKKMRVSGQDESAGKPIAQIKCGKVVFSERKLNLDLHPDTVHEMSEFYLWLKTEGLNDGEQVPDEFLPLLAKLIQDSDSNLQTLAKKVHTRFFPCETDGRQCKFISLKNLKSKIEEMAKRINYGVSDGNNGSIWRWEVKDDALFPAHHFSNIQIRRKKRNEAKAILQHALETLDIDEKEVVMACKKDKEAVTKIQQKEKEQRELERNTAKAKKEQERLEKIRAKEQDRESKEKEAERLKAEKEQKLKDAEKDRVSQLKISNFFKTKSAESSPRKVDSYFALDFPQFHVKPDMIMAKRNRANPRAPTIDQMKFLRRAIRKASARGTVAVEAAVVLKNARVKLLQFCENYRPGYYGTWNKKSTLIGGRRPYKVDKVVLAYDVESDEDWEEDDDEGEECLTDEEDEEEDEDSLLEDGSDWLVPHGYLSDDEGIDKEAELFDSLNNSPVKPAGQTGLKVSEAEFRAKMKLDSNAKPMIYGPSFDDNSAVSQNILAAYRIVFATGLKSCDPLAVTIDLSEPQSAPSINDGRRKPFPDDLVPALALLINQSAKGIERLTEQFRAEHGQDISKSSIQSKIKEIATKIKKPDEARQLYHINSDFKHLVPDTVNPQTAIIGAAQVKQ